MLVAWGLCMNRCFCLGGICCEAAFGLRRGWMRPHWWRWSFFQSGRFYQIFPRVTTYDGDLLQVHVFSQVCPNNILPYFYNRFSKYLATCHSIFRATSKTQSSLSKFWAKISNLSMLACTPNLPILLFELSPLMWGQTLQLFDWKPLFLHLPGGV